MGGVYWDITQPSECIAVYLNAWLGNQLIGHNLHTVKLTLSSKREMLQKKPTIEIEAWLWSG